MKIPAKYKDRVSSIEIEEGQHSEDPQRDAYAVQLANGWGIDGQSFFMCDTQKEVLEIIRSAESV